MIQKEIITVPCPNCKKTIVWDKSINQWRPFCSKRCQLIDLGQWFSETEHITNSSNIFKN